MESGSITCSIMEHMDKTVYIKTHNSLDDHNATCLMEKLDGSIFVDQPCKFRRSIYHGNYTKLLLLLCTN